MQRGIDRVSLALGKCRGLHTPGDAKTRFKDLPVWQGAAARLGRVL